MPTADQCSKIKLVIIIGIGFLLNACDRAQLHQDTFYSFGTIIEVSIISNDSQTAEQAMQLIQTELNRMHTAWHAWEDSELTRLNQQLQQQNWFTADQELLDMVTLSRDYFELSDGLFDPAIGALIQAWGFHASEFENQQTPALNTLSEMQRVQASMHDIEIREYQLRGKKNSLQLDLGGIAKGYGLDKISQQLQRLGVNDFMLNAGGDIVANGQHINRPWRVGVRGPQADQVIAVVNIEQYEGVFSSGNYERFYDTANGRAHHVIDPRSAQPSTTLVAATVIHSNPALADAAATAILVAGTGQWRQIANNMGISSALVIDDAGQIHSTNAMAARLNLKDNLMYSATTDKM